MAVSVHTSIWDNILEHTNVAQEKGSDPLLWAVQLSSSLSSAGVSLPSVEVANLLVSHICWGNNVPIAWKFLEKALMIKIVPPMPVLALLSTRSLFSDVVFVLFVILFYGELFGGSVVGVFFFFFGFFK